jgi:hypothetical protein
METKASGKDIILAVLDNMRESCEPLLYETLAPSHFSVYLHRDDYSRLSTIFPKIREEGYKALDEELAKLNKFNKKSFSFRSRSKASKVSVASTNWSVNFYADENNELSVGDILIHSQLSLPNQIEYGVGTKTQRSETLHSGGETKRLRKIQIEEKPDNQPAFARLSYKGKDGKNCEYFMTSAEISVGRGGKTEFCDLLVEGPADVSRQHFSADERILHPGRQQIWNFGKWRKSESKRMDPPRSDQQNHPGGRNHY